MVRLRARRGALVAALALALALAACADTEQSCGPTPLAQLPIVLRRNIPVVAATVNDQPAELIIDTGAEHTVLLSGFVGRIGLRRDFRHAVLIRGIGSALATAVAYPDEIRLGGVAIAHPPVIVAAFSTGDLPGGTPDGLLGADVLSRFDVDVNVPGGALTLYPACPAGRMPPWSEPASPLDGRLARGRFFVPLLLDGVPVPVALDTGAEYSLVSTRAAAASGVSAVALAGDPPTYLTVVGPDPVLARVHRFRQLRLGGENYANPTLPVIPISGNPIDGILGMNYLRHHRVWLSYASGRVFVGPAVR